MPQHTSTRKSPGTAGGTEGVLDETEAAVPAQSAVSRKTPRDAEPPEAAAAPEPTGRRGATATRPEGTEAPAAAEAGKRDTGEAEGAGTTKAPTTAEAEEAHPVEHPATAETEDTGAPAAPTPAETGKPDTTQAHATAETGEPHTAETPATAETEDTGAPAAPTHAVAADPASGEAPTLAEEAPEESAVQAPPAAGTTEAAGAAPAPPAPLLSRRPRAAWVARTRRRRQAHPAAARGLSVGVTVLAAALVVVVLVLPNSVVGLRPAQFTRIPAEAVIGAALMLALPRRPRIVLAAVSGVALAGMTVLNLLDMGFNQYLGRPFNPVLDWSLLGDAQSYLEDSLGRTATLAATAGLVALILLLAVLLALSMVRLSNLLARHTGIATRGTLIAGVVWITCSSLGLQVAGVPIAADRTATSLKAEARRVSDTLKDEAEFEKVAEVDRFGNTPGSQLVPDLRGKDVIFTFIESYGRTAIEDPITAPGVDATLDARTKALGKAGFHARSGWLTSATYGGSSWLGHSTTMSGLWISNQQRYRTVMASDHMSLTDAFKRTGDFDTVGVMPGVQKGWPEQKWYGLDKVYNAFQLGYRGPKFSWSTMPDQYALQQYQERVHGRKPAGGKSRMSLLILTSSHQPWAPIPKTAAWDQLGDGSVFKGMEAAGNRPADVIADTTKSREEYGKSIQYSVTALTQWLERYGDDDTVLVFLGDHQPIARVSGDHAGHDVPVAIVAKDPKVLDKVSGWGWTDGLRPAHDAPVWKMSSFRDRFLTAYGSTPHPKTR